MDLDNEDIDDNVDEEMDMNDAMTAFGENLYGLGGPEDIDDENEEAPNMMNRPGIQKKNNKEHLDSMKKTDRKARQQAIQKGSNTGTDQPVDFTWLVRFWKDVSLHPRFMTQCRAINTSVKLFLEKITANFCYLVVLIKPNFLWNPILALLQLIDESAIGGIFNPRAIIDLILKFPPIQMLLRAVRFAFEKIVSTTSFRLHGGVAPAMA